MADLVHIDAVAGAPVVGETYLVPSCAPSALRGRRVPVLGPPHEDREVFGLHNHVHYDLRFLPLDVIPTILGMCLGGDPSPVDLVAIFAAACGDEGGIQDLLPGLFGTVSVLPDAGLVPHPFRCVRSLPPYPVHLAAQWMERLEARYVGARLDACGRCPHRGFPMIAAPDADGIRTCVGHGLRFDTDGRVIPSARVQKGRHGR